MVNGTTLSPKGDQTDDAVIRAQALITGEPYDQRYISVIRVRDGHIVHYKDYWNPLALLRTLKGEEVMKAVTMD